MLRRQRAAPEEDAERGGALDRAAAAAAARLSSLSDLTAPLAVSYLERIERTAAALTTGSGAALTALGYAAHTAVEADGGPWGVVEVPVLGDLPARRGGRPPQDLLLRVVKATRRPFPSIRAVDGPTWEGFVTARTAATDPPLDRALVDGILRFGWVLRQVDLRYGTTPEARP